MAIIYSLSTKSDNAGQNEILIRYKSGNFAARAKSGVYTLPEWYNFVVGNGLENPYKGKRIITDAMKEAQSYHEQQKIKLSEINRTISETLKTADRNSSEWLKDCIDKYYRKGKYAAMEKVEQKQTFFEAFDEFLSMKKFSDCRRRSYMVVICALKRFEIYRQIADDNPFLLALDNVTPKILSDFDKFLRNEHVFAEQYPELYEKVPESRKPAAKGQNTINCIFAQIRAFFIWAADNEKTGNNPFHKFKIEESVYGTPYYISIEERNLLYSADLSHCPALAVQRDIFVFQCLVGCRVADFYKFTRQNIINGAIEYIARKTKDGRPVTVRVPLNAIAREILAKYAGFEGKTLFPYISEQKYNKAIKEAFANAGLTRNVVVLDPLTRESVIRPLNEIASSHLARRCFVGNLYRQVKDPSLVGALSGHKEGSRAFARYREIDEEMKIELVKMLE
jgi:site-specific recombinase XerD